MKPRRSATASQSKRAALKLNFPVVGIGASAGGLEALAQFLRPLPANLEMAIIIIQHLDPTHESLSVEILSRATALPISIAKNNERITKGHIYVIPANHDLILHKSHLKFSPRSKTALEHKPIDLLFKSLARELGEKAIGIVLSGVASDGTKGIIAIKAKKGITLAQDPASAKFDGMPRNAIATGKVDFVEKPDALAKKIIETCKKPSPQQDHTKHQSKPENLKRIFALLQKETQADFSQYKLNTIERRITRRLVALKIKNYSDYVHYLETHREEIQKLFNEALIHVTRFFRDQKSFLALKNKVFPKYLKNFDSTHPFRIWVPGCATGEEAYSIAISFFEAMDAHAGSIPIQIFATDISEEAIRKARLGIYPETISKDVSKSRLSRFFEKTKGGYKVSKQLRDTCVFSKHDCTINPPFAKVDLISCRNLLIYFNSELQKRVMPIFHYALKPEGVLWLGSSETVNEFSKLFSTVDKNNRFYSKKNTASSTRVQFPMNRFIPEAVNIAANVASLAVSRQDIQREADRMTLVEYSPPSVVINDSFEILQARGHTAPFLELPSGQVSLSLLKMVRRELVIELRSMIEIAHKKGVSVKREGITFKIQGKMRTVTLRVAPIRIAGSKELFFSIYFEEEKIALSPKGVRSKGRLHSKEKSLSEMRQKLLANQDYQQSLSEEYETTQEALTASNEELQSTNEELQSTNEELETAKEELQSSNEELTTVNDELQIRNAELLQAANDLNNILSSVDIPIALVGSDSKIRRFTPNASKPLKIIPADVGRPIGDIKPDIHIQHLDKIVSEVMKTSVIKEMDAQDGTGKWHRLQVRPYRTVENKIDGAVIAFIEIDTLKRNAEELKRSRDDCIAIIEGLAIPLLVINAERRIKLANQAFCNNFQSPRSEIEGKYIFELGNGTWNIPKLIGILNKTFTESSTFQNVEIEQDFPKIGKRVLLLSATKTQLTGSGESAILLAIEDLTDRRLNEIKLRESEEKYKGILASSYDGIMVTDQNGLIKFVNHKFEEMFGYAPNELLDQNYERLIPARNREKHKGNHANYVAHPTPREMGKGLELYGIRKDGTEFPIDVSLSPVRTQYDVLVTCIVRNISEVKKIEQERNRILARERELRSEAEQTNRIKDEFLATLSHELRTPLTTILTWSQILSLGMAEGEKLKQGIQVIERSAKSQSQLIDDLLDVSRIHSGKLLLNISEIDPAEIIHAALEVVHPLALMKSIEIETEFNSIDGRVLADPARLQQVIWNLLTNAIKFSHKNSKILVKVDQVPKDTIQAARIQISDSGCGIKAEFLPHIFERFTQADSSTTRTYGGLGLGMSIVKSLIEMHGGTVKAESPGVGKGSIFTLTLPLKPYETKTHASTQTSLLLPSPKFTNGTPVILKGTRLLLVDDEADARGALAQMLVSLGAEVSTADSADNALKQFLASKPDILVSDIGMPGEDGYALIKKIRALKTDQGKKTPAIALSAYAGSEDVRLALAAGFSQHLAKPVDALTLSQAIAVLTRKKKT